MSLLGGIARLLSKGAKSAPDVAKAVEEAAALKKIASKELVGELPKARTWEEVGKEENAKALARFKETGDIEGVSLGDLRVVDEKGRTLSAPKAVKEKHPGFATIEPRPGGSEEDKAFLKHKAKTKREFGIGLNAPEHVKEYRFSHKGLVEGSPGRAEFDKAIKAGMPEEDAYDYALDWINKQEP
jgi:hypothetical protein